MAGAHGSLFSLLITPSNNTFTTRTPPPLPLLLSSIPSSASKSKPSKIRHRKNFLRPKILKTLTKPHPIVLPLPPPQQPQSPLEDDLFVENDLPAEADAGEAGNFRELRFSETETTREYNGISGKLSSGSIFKYGVCLVGIFVFQTIYSVWIMGNDNSNQKAGDLEVNGSEKRNHLLNGSGKTIPVSAASSVLYLEDQLEIEKKIEEIKVMAREARKIEEKKKEEEDEDEDPETDDESDSSSHRIGIEREISARLLKLQNKVNTDKDKSAALRINRLGNSGKSTGGVARDNVNMNQGKEELMFKKKFKYRSPSTNQRKTPKGFSGIRDRRASDAKKRDSVGRGTAQDYGTDATDHAEILYEDKQVNQQGVEARNNVSSVGLEEGGKLVDEESKANLNKGKDLEEKMQTPNMEAEIEVKNKNISKGGVQETSSAMSAPEVIQSRESRALRTQKPQGFSEEIQDTGPIIEKDDVLSINGSSRHGLAKKKSAANSVKFKQANTETDMWWLNLPYVLVILMQRGSDGEGPAGLYSLKPNFEEHYQNDYSYTVAFEDNADANNFCFLLESFFEDLGDFSAHAVPMSIQELIEEVKSHAKKVVVVKKRQLQLYAGQPLTDVEIALCSLIEQSQNVI